VRVGILLVRGKPCILTLDEQVDTIFQSLWLLSGYDIPELVAPIRIRYSRACGSYQDTIWVFKYSDNFIHFLFIKQISNITKETQKLSD
jgi:hypothetical protein